MIHVSSEKYFFVEKPSLDNYPNGIYELDYDQMSGAVWGNKMPDFILPEKIWGNPQDKVNKVLRCYNSIKQNLGVYLLGNKGSGKTIMSKMLAMQLNVPVFIIDSRFSGKISLLKNWTNTLIKHNPNACFIFDEFEKGFGNDDQEELLTILDGVHNSKFVFIFVANENKMNKYMQNRLSRIRYRFDFSHLEKDMINEILTDLEVDPSYHASIHRLMGQISTANIDMLLHLIDEIKLSNEPLKDIIKYLNIEKDETYYTMSYFFNDMEIEPYNSYSSEDHENRDEVYIRFKHRYNSLGKPLVSVNLFHDSDEEPEEEKPKVKKSKDAKAPKETKHFLQKITGNYINLLDTNLFDFVLEGRSEIYTYKGSTDFVFKVVYTPQKISRSTFML